MTDIPKIKTRYFGELYAPDELNQLARVLERISIDFHAPEAWRGQANISWQVTSTAVRRLNGAAAAGSIAPIGNSTTYLEDMVRNYESRLLNEARLKGFGFRNGKMLTDLEILAMLQHYGAATRLLDFTRNVFIALWFACASLPDEYGVLLGADLVTEDNIFIRVKEQQMAELPISKLVERYPEKRFVWEPTQSYERMRIQQSIFFWGYSHNGVWGSLSQRDFYNEKRRSFTDGFFAIAVSPRFKAWMASNWRILFGYDVSTLFPDIEGFGRFHSATSPFEWDYFGEV